MLPKLTAVLAESVIYVTVTKTVWMPFHPSIGNLTSSILFVGPGPSVTSETRLPAAITETSAPTRGIFDFDNDGHLRLGPASPHLEGTETDTESTLAEPLIETTGIPGMSFESGDKTLIPGTITGRPTTERSESERSESERSDRIETTDRMDASQTSQTFAPIENVAALESTEPEPVCIEPTEPEPIFMEPTAFQFPESLAIPESATEPTTPHTTPTTTFADTSTFTTALAIEDFSIFPVTSKHPTRHTHPNYSRPLSGAFVKLVPSQRRPRAPIKVSSIYTDSLSMPLLEFSLFFPVLLLLLCSV